MAKIKTRIKWERIYVPAGKVFMGQVEGGVITFLWITALNRVGLMSYYPTINGENYHPDSEGFDDYNYDNKNPRVISIFNLWGRSGTCIKDKPISIDAAKRKAKKWNDGDNKLVAVWCPVRLGKYYYTIEDQAARDKAYRLEQHPKRGWVNHYGAGKSYSRNVSHDGGHAELGVEQSKDGKTYYWIYYPAPKDDVRAEFSDSEFTTPRSAIDAADKYLRDERKKLSVNSMIGHNSRGVALAA